MTTIPSVTVSRPSGCRRLSRTHKWTVTATAKTTDHRSSSKYLAVTSPFCRTDETAGIVRNTVEAARAIPHSVSEKQEGNFMITLKVVFLRHNCNSPIRIIYRNFNS